MSVGALHTAAEFPDWCLHTGEEPVPETTLHYYFSALIVSAVRWIFRDRTDVFVAANFAWFPMAGDSRDPDVLVAFGRPDIARSSWHNDREDGVSPSVVFEMKSRSNTRTQIAAKRTWYDKHGVDEYYEYDPDQGTFRAWLREEGGHLAAVLHSVGLTSPSLGITFILNGSSLELLGPDGRVLGDYVSAEAAAESERLRAETEIERAETERVRAETERVRADLEFERAETERERADSAIAELTALRAQIAQGFSIDSVWTRIAQPENSGSC